MTDALERAGSTRGTLSFTAHSVASPTGSTMPTNEEVVAAMIEHGGLAERMLANFWLHADYFDRKEIERAFEPEFAKYRALVHYTAMAEEAANEPRSVA